MKNAQTIIFLFLIHILNAQQLDTLKLKESIKYNSNKILRVDYIAYPISTHDAPPENSENFKSHHEIVSLAQSYQHKYSLYINLKTNQSLYKLDTLIVKKPAGKEKMNYMINNNLDFVIKYNSEKYLKSEKIFQREFFSEGKLTDIEWQITDETKFISGLKCRKAVSKNKEMLLSVWYAETISIPSGPVNYFGLPGLVVWSEDFFWTTEISNIQFSHDFDFKTNMESLREEFNKNKKGKFIEEALLIVKKSKLVKSMIDQMR